MRHCPYCNKVKPDADFRPRRARCAACAKEARPKKTPTHNSWRLMLDRCENPNGLGYENYGGRGITVCERWHTFANFLADMGERPSGKTLDRINNNGNYEPSNCRWATRLEQIANSRITKLITINGRTQKLSDWQAEAGIDRDTYRMRMKAGWPQDLALTTPPLPAGGRRGWRELLQRSSGVNAEGTSPLGATG